VIPSRGVRVRTVVVDPVVAIAMVVATVADLVRAVVSATAAAIVVDTAAVVGTRVAVVVVIRTADHALGASVAALPREPAVRPCCRRARLHISRLRRQPKVQ
jgi:hypothetical protein